MRAFDFTLYMIMFVLAIGVVAAMLPPSYTMQRTAEGESVITTVANWQISAVAAFPSQFATGTTGASPLDSAWYYLSLAIAGLTSILGLISILLVSYPVLTMVFPIPSELGAIINAVFTISIIMAIVQLYRGGSTKWNE